MGWFSRKYDVFVVDYKVVIKENSIYKRAQYGIILGIIVAFITLCTIFSYDNNDPNAWYTPLIFLVSGGIFFALFSKPTTAIEIDNEKKTIRVRDKYDIERKDVVSIKVSNEKGSGGYFYDYLSLVCESSNETAIYLIFRTKFGNETAEVEETEKIAKLIAETLGLTLIIETNK